MSSNSQHRSSVLSGCLLRLLLIMVMAPVVGYFVVFGTPGQCNGFINKACKAKQWEGKAYAGAINRAQQGYYLEHHKFASSIEALGLGIQSRTKTYEYSIRTTPESAIVYAVPTAELTKAGYVGGVFLGKTQQGEDTTLAILCEAKGQEATLKVKPLLKNGLPTCPRESSPLNQ